jgi:transcriptional regulator with XRE-family HTH domain
MDDLAERKALGDRIDRARRLKGMTLAEVAHHVGYDERTIRNVINGQAAKPRTVREICEAVGLKMDDARTAAVEIAEDQYGGYSSKAFNKYLGAYRAFRWSYETSNEAVSSLFTLGWSIERKCITFRETQKYRDAKDRPRDFSQSGDVYSSEDTGLLHLLTCIEGRLRLITLTRTLPILRGAVLTQSSKAMFQKPGVSPIVLTKLASQPDEETSAKLIGKIDRTSPDYDEVSDLLHSTEMEVVDSVFSSRTVYTGKDRRRQDPALTKDV